jgi:hypothetical protein
MLGHGDDEMKGSRPEHSIWPYLIRGAVGGVFGGSFAQVLLPKFHYGPGTKWLYFIFFLLATVPIRAGVGAIIGSLVWKSRSWRRQQIGPVSGAVVGGILLGFGAALLAYFRYDEIQHSILGPAYIRDSTIMGICTGVAAGIIAGLHNRKKKASLQI